MTQPPLECYNYLRGPVKPTFFLILTAPFFAFSPVCTYEIMTTGTALDWTVSIDDFGG